MGTYIAVHTRAVHTRAVHTRAVHTRRIYLIHKDQFTGECNLVIGVHCVRMNGYFIIGLCIDGYQSNV